MCAACSSWNSRGNVLVGTLLYPVLAFSFAFAEEIVTLVYTAAYLEAAPVMRVYIAGIAIMVVEISSVLLMLRQGNFALGIHTVALAVSVAVSWTLAGLVGLAGAAAGSVVAALSTAWCRCGASRRRSASRCVSCRTGAASPSRWATRSRARR